MGQAASAFCDHMQQLHTVCGVSSRALSVQLIADCVRAAGTAPSGANHRPWHIVAVSNAAIKSQIRAAAEEKENKFYDGGPGGEWFKALEPIGTHDRERHLDTAP